MLARARRHPLISAAILLAVLVVAGAGGAAWYLLGEARRTGRLAATVLSSQLGVTVLVARARADGARGVVLYDVHVPPGPHWGGDVRIGELRVGGGILPVVFPRGRSLSIVALTTSVTPPPADTAAEPATAALAVLRAVIVSAGTWPGGVSVEVPGAEVRGGGDALRLDVIAHKTAAGTLDVKVKSVPLTLDVARAAADAVGRVSAHVRLEALPTRLLRWWPADLPAVTGISFDGEVGLPPEGDVDVKGRLTATLPGESVPLSAQLDARYRPRTARLDVPALLLTWGPEFRLEGKVAAEEVGRIIRLTFDMSGMAAGVTVSAEGSYVPSTAALSARARTRAVASRTLFARAGMAPGPVDVTARATRSSLNGTAGARGGRLAVESVLEGMELPAVLPGTPLDGTLRADVSFRRGKDGLELTGLESTALTVTRGGATIATVTAASPAGAAWPIAVDARMPDLRRVPVAALPARLTGRAQVTGALAREGSALRFTGDVTADLPRVESTLGGATVFLNARARLPVAWGTGSPPGRGSVFVERVEAYGLTLDRLVSSAELADSRLALPDMKWVHYDGHGWGWMEVALDGRPVPVRARLEGERIDLTTLTREYGITAAQVSGKVRYLLVLQYAGATGLTIVGQVTSEEGGKVSIEVIESLLDSAQVQAESSGVLKQTLENLRVFDYASLEGDVRVTASGGYVNLSLVGKKRLGIFPPPVKAINLRNVPIALLVRLFSRREPS